MSNATLATAVWGSVAIHVVVALLAWRRPAGPPLLLVVNLLVALGVLAYWIPAWYRYFARGTRLWATDQLVPLYALVVLVLACLALAGRYAGNWPHRLAFGIDTGVLVAAAWFLTFFRFTRLF